MQKLSTLCLGLTTLILSCSAFAAAIPSSLHKNSSAVKMSLWDPVIYLDPAYTTKVGQAMVFEALFEGLVKRHDNKIVPARASSWKISEDGKKYTFKLRDNIKWSDGKPEVASDYVTAFRRLLDPSLDKAARPSYLIQMIKNAREIEQGTKSLDSLGVYAPDDKTVVFELIAPASYFLQVLLNPSLVAVPGHMVAKHGNDWWNQPQLVSNGCYRLVHKQDNGDLKMKKGKEIGCQDASEIVIFKVMDDQSEAHNSLLTGKLDISYKLNLRNEEWMVEKLGYRLIKRVLPRTVYAIFNTRLTKLSDPKVRQALELTIDRAAIARAMGAKPAITFAVPTMLNADQLKLLDSHAVQSKKERLTLARKLLEEAGYSRASPLRLDIMIDEREDMKKAGTAMRSMFARVGIDARLKKVTKIEGSANLRSKNFEVTVAGWNADYDDAMTFYSILKTTSSKNHSSFRNKEFESLTDEALQEKDDEARQMIYARIEKLLREQSPIVPLFHSGRAAIASSRIRDPGMTGLAWIAVQDIRLRD